MGTGGEGDGSQSHHSQKNKAPSNKQGSVRENRHKLSPEEKTSQRDGAGQWGETLAWGPSLSPSPAAHTAHTRTVPEKTHSSTVLRSSTGAHGPAFEVCYSLIHTRAQQKPPAKNQNIFHSLLRNSTGEQQQPATGAGTGTCP